MTRREFLRETLLSLTALVAWRPGGRVRRAAVQEAKERGAKETFGLSADQRAAASSHLTVSPASEPPLALSVHEMATVTAIAAIIVPTDRDPGAAEANVADYIDRKVSGNPAEQQRYVDGVRWIDRASGKLFGRGRRFGDLSLAQQTEVLQAAEETLNMRLRPVASLWARAWRKVQKIYDDAFGLGGGASFGRFVRDDVLAGFYTNPISWSMLGYVGPPQPRGYPHYEDCPPQARR